MNPHPFFSYSKIQINLIIEFYLIYHIGFNRDESINHISEMYNAYIQYINELKKSITAKAFDVYFMEVHNMGGLNNYLVNLIEDLISDLGISNIFKEFI